MLQLGEAYRYLVRVDSDPVEHYVDKFRVNIGLDLKMAIKFAAREFLRTEEGRAYLKSTGGAFNFGDAIEQIPNDITIKHGYVLKYHVEWETISVDQNEDLVPDDVRKWYELEVD